MWDIKRDDPLLVEVVENIGNIANGQCSRLRIAKIPDDVVWNIEDYDGYEHVSEAHRIWTGEEADD